MCFENKKLSKRKTLVVYKRCILIDGVLRSSYAKTRVEIGKVPIMPTDLSGLSSIVYSNENSGVSIGYINCDDAVEEIWDAEIVARITLGGTIYTGTRTIPIDEFGRTKTCKIGGGTEILNISIVTETTLPQDPWYGINAIDALWNEAKQQV